MSGFNIVEIKLIRAKSDRQQWTAQSRCYHLLQGGRLFLQVADVLVVDIQIDESPQLALFRVKVFAELGMLRNQRGHGLTDGFSPTSTEACLPTYCRRGVGM